LKPPLSSPRAEALLDAPRAGAIAAVGAGALLPGAFEPFGIGALAPLPVAVIFLTFGRSTPRRAFWRGFLFGLGMFGVGTSWIIESFQYSHIAFPVALSLTVSFVLFLALLPALLGALAAGLRTEAGAAYYLLLLPAAWVLIEWVRGRFLPGFTWLQLGYSQIDTPLSGYFPLGGTYAVSALVGVIAGALAWAVAAPRARWWRAGALVVAIVAVGAGLRGIEWTERSGRPLHVALVQGNVAQAMKWRPEVMQLTLRHYVELSARHWGADLVIWPETALPGLYDDFLEFLAALEREARGHRTDLLIGVVSREGDPPRYFNSVVSVGSERKLYHKRHLVPFGEYLPLKPLLQPVADWLQIAVSAFSRGPSAQAPLIVAGHPVGVSVCYEAAFGEEIIESLPAARLLVNVSNDAWFGDSIAPHQHLQIARARALESGRYLLRATNTGISAIVGPRGELIARSPQFEAATLAGMAQPMAGATPYVRMGNGPALAAVALVAVVGAIARWRGGGFALRSRG
jgi:apolipoprotein N-acyltransferase